MLIGSILGEVNSRIILALLFYLVFTPMSAFMRLIGRDSMDRKFDPDRKTYRVIKRGRPASHLKHQFDERKIMLDLAKEIWLLLKERKKLWLLPIVVVLGVLGTLIVLTEGSAVAPFIYTLF